ncbi:MAG TPA: PA2169 family four-helix-bundle protein [Bryobacteraceae bacterium]|nr:PA2169 family four-helix-bundle protein [Bryobacteraceae bacterium]
MGVDVNGVKEILTDLVQTLHDSQENFRKAAERAQSSEMKLMLMDFATERARFAGELQNEILRLGDPDPPDWGTFKGSLQRTFMGLKVALAHDRDRVLLQECERGEDAVIEKYGEALRNELPRYIREMLEYQLEEIGASRVHLQAVEQQVS